MPWIAALPPFRDKEALEMRQDLVQVDGAEKGGRSRGALASKIDSLTLGVSRDNHLYSSVSSWAFSRHFP